MRSVCFIKQCAVARQCARPCHSRSLVNMVVGVRVRASAGLRGKVASGWAAGARAHGRHGAAAGGARRRRSRPVGFISFFYYIFTRESKSHVLLTRLPSSLLITDGVAVGARLRARGVCFFLRYVHPDSAVRVRNDLLRWIMGFLSLTRMGWELTNNGRSAISSLSSS